MKNYTEALVRIMTNKMLEKLWIHLIVDFIMKLLLVVEKDAILLICDKLSKIAYFIAITEGTLEKGLARLFKNNM